MKDGYMGTTGWHSKCGGRRSGDARRAAMV